MGLRSKQEPPYLTSAAELNSYCRRFVDALKTHVGDRLVCVLLSGSWARGEARPPSSDVDLTVVVDTVDDDMMQALKGAWQASQVGCSNVYSLIEVQNMSREALEMCTINAEVLWGHNPFPAPTREDFADDLARVTEAVLRDARCLILYDWLTEDERRTSVASLTGKYGLEWALRNLVAFRKGEFPRTFEDVRIDLEGTSEGGFLKWLEDNPEATYEVAQKVNQLAAGWFAEVAEYRSSN